MIHQALAGLMFHNGSADRQPLYGSGYRLGYTTGIAAYIATQAAPHARSRGGAGQIVETSLLETGVAMLYPVVTQYAYSGLIEPRRLETPTVLVRCRTGWVCIFMYVPGFAPVCAALGLDELITDPRFADPQDRWANWIEFTHILRAHLADRDADELVTRLQSIGQVAAKVHDALSLAASDHLRDRGYWETAPGESGQRILGPPFRLAASPRVVRAGTPVPGGDNALLDADMRAGAAPARELEGVT
jgi:crotonobetainyl-CoA:carnitine CoA-transferase CaiB-like acyl-CoA transferase